MKVSGCAQMCAPGKAVGQAATRHEVDLDRLLSLKVESRRSVEVSSEIRKNQDVDLKLLETRCRHLLRDERRIVVLGKSPGIGPVSPARCRELQLREGSIECELYAAHFHLRLGMLELGEARHEHVPRDQ